MTNRARSPTMRSRFRLNRSAKTPAWNPKMSAGTTCAKKRKLRAEADLVCSTISQGNATLKIASPKRENAPETHNRRKERLLKRSKLRWFLNAAIEAFKNHPLTLACE